MVTMASAQPILRAYRLCSFSSQLGAPWIDLIDAADDEEALALARVRNVTMSRELWDRHRLVAALPAVY